MIEDGRASARDVNRLIQEGVDVNAADKEGRTLLMWAARFNADEAVLLALIEKGANVNAASLHGATPLMFAAISHLNHTALLPSLEKGANVNATDKNGTTPLMIAAMHNSVPAILSVLIEKGANVNATDKNGVTPLMYANNSPNIEKILSVLLENDADAAKRDIKGNTAFDYVEGHPDLEGTKVYSLLREKTPSSTAKEAPQERAQYLSAQEIQGIINKYVNERPVTEVIDELGEPATRTEDFVKWFKEKNGLMIVMRFGLSANTLELLYLSDVYANRNLREKRYEHMTAEFKKIHTIAPARITEHGVIWDMDNGCKFSIMRQNVHDEPTDYFSVMYVFIGPQR
jgi:ankyrin repeat protein